MRVQLTSVGKPWVGSLMQTRHFKGAGKNWEQLDEKKAKGHSMWGTGSSGERNVLWSPTFLLQ